MSNDERYTLSWTREQDKAFEKALASVPQDCSIPWEGIATVVPGKTIDELMLHFKILSLDVYNIDNDLVPLPRYQSLPDQDVGPSHGNSWLRNRRKLKEQERRKGIAWTEEEHRLFLLGLESFGKGDWRSISRNYVVSRTPTQVASHAQKYFNRLNSTNKERRRASIHDITIASRSLQAPQVPIAAAPTFSQTLQPSAGPHGTVMLGSTLAQPVNGMVSFIPPVGAPVNHHLAETAVPGAPLSMQQPLYPFPPTDR